MSSGVRLFLLCNLLAMAWGNVSKAEPTLLDMRKTFLQAEQAIYQRQDADYFATAETLKTYPLYPYLQYQWLKNHLDNDQAVEDFLSSYEQSRYSKLLRQKWLVQLGKNKQWQTFINYYHNTDDPELQCYFAQAHYENNLNANALDSVRLLWLSGKSLPNNCENLFTVLKTATIFSQNLIWQRFLAALQLDNISLAQNLSSQLNNQDQIAAELWLKYHRDPTLISKENKDVQTWKHNYPLAGALFTHAITQWLEDAPSAANTFWELEKESFNIPASLLAETDKRLAMALAFKRDPRAFSKLMNLNNKDNSSREWAVRIALSHENWTQVAEALSVLTEEEKLQDKWQYWQARTYEANQQVSAAQSIYQRIAKNRSYYGFLAANHIQQKITIIDQPIQVAESEILAMAEKPEFKVMSELLAIGRKQEAKHQWWHATAGMDQHNLIVAAKLAQNWQAPALAIFTVAKANEWDDIDLRFPLLYQKPILDYANSFQLDPAFIYGLIRQESAFDESADSPAGAKGLMQIMPKTGQQIAQTLNENWSGEADLFNPTANIKFGSVYYQKLLQQFKGKHLLAAAAYNAGPNRIKRWLPDKNALAGDCWIESIPYKETRNYVSQVMFYALIYQQRLQRDSLKLTDLITDVQPN